MPTAEYNVIAEAEKTLYIATHRAPKNDALDKARSHGTPYQPQHCRCQACSHGFTHIAGIARSLSTEVTRRDPIEETHGRWVLRILDDQPIADDKQVAADSRVEVLHDGTVFKGFLYPSYRIWTLLAHWKDSLDPEGAPVTCEACRDTGLVDWAPGQQRDTEDDQQPCPDCSGGRS